MRRTLPTCQSTLVSLIALALGLVAGAAAYAQVAGEEGQPEVEVIKQLVFIEQFLYEAGVYDGIEAPFDVRVAPDGAHVYVASLKNDALTYFSRDGESGELSYADSVTLADIGEDALNGVRSLAMSPSGDYVYAVAMFSDSLSSFSRNPATGSLVFVDALYDSVGGVDGLDGPRSIVVSPDGKHLYVAAYDESKVSAFSRSSGTGAASFLAVYEKGDQGVEELTNPHALALSPDGKHLYVALWGNEVVTFSRDASTGLLSYESKLAYLTGETKKESPRALALSPDGKFLYVASANNDALSVFARNSDTGALAVKSTVIESSSGVFDMDGPHAISISSDGKYIYIASVSSDSVTSFERNFETGAVSYYQSLVSGAEDPWVLNGPISIGTSPDGEHVYVGSGSGTHSVLTFRREVLVDPPEFVVQPVDQLIEAEQSAAFYALAQGVDLSYQWLRDGLEISGETLPVLTLDSVSSSDDGSAFQVRVSNPGGILTSNAVTLTVLPPIVVQAPSDLTVLDDFLSSSSARLAWTDQSDNETGFEIQRRLPGGVFSTVANVPENQHQYEDLSLTASTTYIYRIRAKRVEVVSLWSNDAVIESFNNAPQSPVNLRIAKQTYNTVGLRWSDRSAVEVGFEVYRRPDETDSLWSLVGTTEKNETSFEDRDVAAESTYAYRVRAFNESGASEVSNSVVALTSSLPVDSISPISRTIGAAAGSGYIVGVSSSKEWEALPDVEWLLVTSPVGGQGSGDQGVTYRSLLNESQEERSGKIIVGGREHTVLQEGSEPFLRLSPNATEIDSDGGAKRVAVEANVAWVASENAAWVSIESGLSGRDYGSIMLSVEPNEGFESRSAQLTVNSVLHAINQSGRLEELDLSSNVSQIVAEGGSSSFGISGNIAWTASVLDSWIIVDGVPSGNGDGTVSFTVFENPGFETRSAEISVNDLTHTVQQAARLPRLELDAVKTHFDSPADTGEISVNSNQAWSASVSASWIFLSGNSSGNGDGEIRFAIEENGTTETRFGEITVNDEAIGITQDPAPLPEVDAPAWASVELGPLGVELAWNDLSDNELGFRLSRSVLGSAEWVEVAELAADTTTFLDRRAPRGVPLEYRLVAFDRIGDSGPAVATLEDTAASNMITVALQLAASSDTKAFLAGIPMAGSGDLILDLQGVGPAFSELSFGRRYPAARYRLDSDLSRFEVLSEAGPADWVSRFQFARFETLEGAEGLIYAADSIDGGSAFPRGARGMGQLLAAESAILVGFAVEGPFELPVLLQASGASLDRIGSQESARQLKLELYLLEDGAAPSLIEDNADWRAATNATGLAIEDVLSTTQARPTLSPSGGEARIVRLLPAGRYLAVLSSASGSTGTAMLEVLDAR